MPIADAVIEMWHGDPTTVAAEDLTAADSVGYDTGSAEMRYYGQFSTDAEGRYSFHSKKPGWYLNGSVFRPSHIHVKVYVGGEERLTTQLYFRGDPYIAGDPWATDARSISLTTSSTGAATGEFDFTMA